MQTLCACDWTTDSHTVTVKQYMSVMVDTKASPGVL